MYQQYLETKWNDTTMNVPGDNVVTDAISPGGGGYHDKSNGPTVLPSNSPWSGKTLLHQHDSEKRKGWKVQDWKISIKHHLPMSLSWCFHHLFVPLPSKWPLFLKYIIQQIITNSMSPPNRCTVTPVAEINLEVHSWTTTCNATTSGSSLGFKDNICEDTLFPSLLTK